MVLLAAGTFVVAMMSLIASVYYRLGRLDSKVGSMKSDIMELKQGQSGLQEGQIKILGLLNQHIGYHRGLGNAVSASADD